MGSTPREHADYAEERERATTTTDPQQRNVEARDRVSAAAGQPATRLGVRPRARIAGWPWAAALVVALGFFAWLIYAVWFT
ncbi:MAG TPA: hypothetical protein VFI37_13555 [Gaiellaceae bacterium]|nr:hypothetical protein [Gaiellaceae bacterium]